MDIRTNPDHTRRFFTKMIQTITIDEIVSGIAARFKPEKIILFGSYAQGTPDRESDLDLLIIQDTDLPRHQRGVDIRLSLIGGKIPIDILVYTSEEYNREKNDRHSFLHSALKTARVLYERND